MAKSRVENYSKKKELKIIEEFKGSDLKGVSYTPLFPYFSSHQKMVPLQFLMTTMSPQIMVPVLFILPLLLEKMIIELCPPREFN